MSGCTESLQLACQEAATWTRAGTILLAIQQCTTIAVASAARQSSMQPYCNRLLAMIQFAEQCRSSLLIDIDWQHVNMCLKSIGEEFHALPTGEL